MYIDKNSWHARLFAWTYRVQNASLPATVNLCTYLLRLTVVPWALVLQFVLLPVLFVSGLHLIATIFGVLHYASFSAAMCIWISLTLFNLGLTYATRDADACQATYFASVVWPCGLVLGGVGLAIAAPLVAAVALLVLAMFVARISISVAFGYGYPKMRRGDVLSVLLEDYQPFTGVQIGALRLYHHWFTMPSLAALALILGHRSSNPHGLLYAVLAISGGLALHLGVLTLRHWDTSRLLRGLRRGASAACDVAFAAKKSICTDISLR